MLGKFGCLDNEFGKCDKGDDKQRLRNVYRHRKIVNRGALDGTAEP